MENQPMLDLLWRVCFRWKLRPRQVTGDTTYGTTEIIVTVEDAGIRAYVPLPDFDHRTRFFGRERFTYDPRRDVYHCPGGQELRFRKHKYTERTRVYQAPAAACHACLLKSECTDSAKGRQVKRSFDEAYLERVRGYHATKEFEGHAQTQSLGGTPVRRSQGLAWAAPLPPAGFGERQQRGAADRRRAEPEALAESPGVGTAPVPERR